MRHSGKQNKGFGLCVHGASDERHSYHGGDTEYPFREKGMGIPGETAGEEGRLKRIPVILQEYAPGNFPKKFSQKICYFVKKTVAFFPVTRYNNNRVTGCGSAWLERRLREAEVASSNPATPMHQRTPEPGYRHLAFSFYAQARI